MDTLTQTAIDLAIKNAFINNLIGDAYLNLQNNQEANNESYDLWYQKPNVGNTPPIIVKPHGTHTWSVGVGRPSLFTFSAVKTNEDNFYRFMRLNMPKNPISMARDKRSYMIHNLIGWQGLEWQFQLQRNNTKWTAAYQLSTSNGVRIWDMKTSTWKPISIPLPDLTQPIDVECLYTLTPDSLTHNHITINGKAYDVSSTQPTDLTTVEKLTIADQCDPKIGGSGSLEVKEISLWLA